MKARSCWPVVATMTSSKPGGFKNVPPPPGSKAGTTYNRFIPREELGDFASWRPDAFGGQGDRRKPAGAEPAAPAAPPEPTAADWQARVAAARQAGYQEGYRDGLVALESFKQTFAQQATAQIGALLDAFDAQFELLDAQLAQAVARTAVQLARQVLRAELEQRPEIVSMVAAEAVNSVMLSARHIAVHVHPLDLPLVAEGAEERSPHAAHACTPTPALNAAVCWCKATWATSTPALPCAGPRPPPTWATSRRWTTTRPNWPTRPKATHEEPGHAGATPGHPRPALAAICCRTCRTTPRCRSRWKAWARCCA
jgi:flagellar assembly protein FliH